MSYGLTGACPSKDLVCPFQNARETAYMEQLRIVRSQRVADAVNDAAMSQPERRALAQIERELSTDPAPIAKTGKAKRVGGLGRAPRTASELISNAKLMLSRGTDP